MIPTSRSPLRLPFVLLLGAFLATLPVRAQVEVEGPSLPRAGGKGSLPTEQQLLARSILTGGNAIYRIFVTDEAGSDCGAWTAGTGPLHPATALPPTGRKNVLYNGEVGFPGTSDTILRSYSSGMSYRTGPNTSGSCEQICDRTTAVDTEPIVTVGPSGGITTGFRTTWTIDDGSSSRRIEFVQEVNVEGPVDGSETVENTVIRETHRVRNLGSSEFRFGLRKHWDWQIAMDDGPAFGDCDSPDEACDRSMDLTGDGTRSGFYPSSYTINHDPALMTCPPGITPLQGGCGGNPLYLVAGTVEPPSALVPPPDAPELLQFNSWDLVVGSCWWPGLVDAAPCGAAGNPLGDDTTIAYFYGLRSSSAIVLAAGEERSFTQYVVAAEDECPGIIQPPALTCDAGGPYVEECSGPVATVQLDGDGSSNSGAEPLYEWSTDCPGGSFDDPTLEDPILRLLTEGCATSCSVTLRVTDADDPDAFEECSSTVLVSDTTGPQLSCPPEPLEIECEDGGITRDHPAVQAWLAEASAFDDCSESDVPVTDDLPERVRMRSCPTIVPVTFTAIDACENVSTCVQELILVDTIPPEPSCPPDRSFECGEPIDDKQDWLDSGTALDGCSGGSRLVPELVSTEMPCPATTIETWRFVGTDSCDNEADCFATWTVGDGTPPLVTPPSPRVNECGTPSQGSQDDWFDEASADDGCSGPLPVMRELVSEERPCPQTLVQTWRFFAIDDCGNEGEAFSTWTEQDTMPPTLTGVPADETASCSAVPPPAMPSADDLCDPAPAVLFDEERIDGSCPGEYELVRTWTARDACGNESSASQRIQVVDDSPPVITGVPADETVDCDDLPPPAEPEAFDDCSTPTLSYVETSEPGSCPGESILTRTWTATDGCGNTSSESQVLTVIDDTPPLLSGVPADATVDCAQLPPPATPRAIDACSRATIDFDELRIDGECPQSYELQRTWTATDECGNAVSETQVLTVVDSTPPMLGGVPADETVDCAAVPAPARPTAVDDCGSATVQFDELRVDGECPQSYELHRTWTATDECGNAASETQVLSVVDSTPPAIAGVPADETVECDAVPPPAEPSATDDCGLASLDFAETRVDGACPQSYELRRTWTAEDECGNATSETQVLTVVDTTPPELFGVPADETVECDSVPPPASPTAVDACGEASLTFDEQRFDGRCPQAYELHRTWTAEDECGNVVSATQVLVVDDTTPPLITGVPADATVECDSVPAPATPSATDNCGSASLEFTETRTDGSCPHEYQLVRTWTSEDDCGNRSSETQVLQVVDTTPPVLDVPAPLVLECNGPDGVGIDDPRVQAWLAAASATDNCSSPVGVGHDAPPVFPLGCPDPIEVIVTFSAVDDCGNLASASSSVTVVDTTPPVIESIDLPGCLWPPNHRYVCFEDLASRVVATDNCSVELTVSVSDCTSDQPDEAPEDGDRGGRELGNGDGNTVDDCVMAPDGSAVCLRSERQGTDREGRNYGLTIAVSDACGNTATMPWTIHVPHDQREGDCEKVDNRSMLKKHEPFPWE